LIGEVHEQDIHSHGFSPWGVIRPRASSIGSFDHLVGTGEQAIGHREAERLRGLEVDHQLVFGWRLSGKVGRLLAEDALPHH